MTARRDKLRPAVFLDRDGTLNEDIGFMDRMEALSLFSWTADAIRLLNRAGFCTVVTTNQSAVARGLIDEEFLRVVHQEIDRRLARGDARIDRYFYCPHHPEAPLEAYRRVCECRKPRPGMILTAARELGLDLDPFRDGGRSQAGRGERACRRRARRAGAHRAGRGRGRGPCRGRQERNPMLSSTI